MAIEFEWDERKARANLAKHGVSFSESKTAFYDPCRIAVFDEGHSDEEDRYQLLGETFDGMLLAVAYVDTGRTIRIISSRKATATERRAYEKKRRFG